MKKIFKHIIAISVITVMIIILFELIIMPFYVRHGKNKKLIDVTSMDIKSAMIMIKTSGFKGVVTDTIYTSEVESNIVLDQHPEPGAIVKSGRTVRLKISQADKLVQVPNIVGQSQRSAQLLLNKVGLKIGAISNCDGATSLCFVVAAIPNFHNSLSRSFIKSATRSLICPK